MYTYTITQWLLLFYLYCFFGWIFESCYVSLLEKHWVNRGFLRSPMLPIYGSGAICILIVCLPVRDNAAAVFVLGIIFPTILEYVTGWAMEQLFHMRYWDYSKHFANLQGYICLQSSIAWGFLSLALVNIIHPPIDHLLMRVPHVVTIILAVVISIQFMSDFVISFRAAFELRKILEEMERLRTQLEEVRVQLNLAQAELRDKLEDFSNADKETRMAALEQSAAQLKTKLTRRLAHQNRYFTRAILRANPTATSRKFAASLALLRQQANEKRKKKK